MNVRFWLLADLLRAIDLDLRNQGIVGPLLASLIVKILAIYQIIMSFTIGSELKTARGRIGLT